MNRRTIIKGTIIAGVASAFVYAALLLIVDAPATFAAMGSVSGSTIAAMLGLTLAGYALRGARWGWLLKRAGHPVPFKDALYLQFAGHSMAVTPGRVGELIKSWLSRDVAGAPLPKGIALLFAERVADLIGVCILSLAGLSVLGGDATWLVLTLAAVAGGTWLASSSWFHGKAIGILSKQRQMAAHKESTAAVFETVHASLEWKAVLVSSAVSALAWGLEGVGFVMCVRELGLQALGGPALVSVYAVSTIVGAFSFLPGGVGLTEASMTGILVGVGMAASGAGAATILIRATTLWWGVVLGAVALATRPGALRAAIGAIGGER